MSYNFTGFYIYTKGSSELITFNIVSSQCVSCKDHINESFLNELCNNSCRTCVNNSWPSYKSYFSAICLDILNFSCNIINDAHHWLFRRNFTVHEFEYTLLTSCSLRWCDFYSFSTNDNQVSFLNVCNWLASSSLVFLINDNKAIHFNFFYKNPFTFVVNMSNMMACWIKAFWSHFIFWRRDKIYLFNFRYWNPNKVKFIKNRI